MPRRPRASPPAANTASRGSALPRRSGPARLLECEAPAGGADSAPPTARDPTGLCRRPRAGVPARAVPRAGVPRGGVLPREVPRTGVPRAGVPPRGGDLRGAPARRGVLGPLTPFAPCGGERLSRAGGRAASPRSRASTGLRLPAILSRALLTSEFSQHSLQKQKSFTRKARPSATSPSVSRMEHRSQKRTSMSSIPRSGHTVSPEACLTDVSQTSCREEGSGRRAPPQAKKRPRIPQESAAQGLAGPPRLAPPGRGGREHLWQPPATTNAARRPGFPRADTASRRLTNGAARH